LLLLLLLLLLFINETSHSQIKADTNYNNTKTKIKNGKTCCFDSKFGTSNCHVVQNICIEIFNPFILILNVIITSPC
jgi:hypothetical protein